MLAAVKTCFAKYAVFSGRARRPEYWYFMLFNFIMIFLLSLLDFTLFGVDVETQDPVTFLTPLYQLAVFIPAMAVGWRRLHDSGKPGWYLLIPLALSFGLLLVMLLGVIGFAAMDASGAPEETLRTEASVLGSATMLIGVVGQLVVVLLVIWWMTRPSDAGPNDYGPEPPSP